MRQIPMIPVWTLRGLPPTPGEVNPPRRPAQAGKFSAPLAFLTAAPGGLVPASSKMPVMALKRSVIGPLQSHRRPRLSLNVPLTRRSSRKKSIISTRSSKAPPEQPAQAGKVGVKSVYGALFAAFNVVLSINTEEEVVLGESGYWRGTWKASLAPKAGGDAVEAEGKFLTINRREADGGWKIHRNIWNSPTPMVMPTT